MTTSCLCWQIQLIKLSCICLFFAWACTSPAKIFVSHSFAKCNAVVTKYLQITLTAELQKEAAHYCTFCGFSNGSKITNTNKKMHVSVKQGNADLLPLLNDKLLEAAFLLVCIRKLKTNLVRLFPWVMEAVQLTLWLGRYCWPLWWSCKCWTPPARSDRAEHSRPSSRIRAE